VPRGEFDQLKTRVDILEREVEGEKMVTRHILEQTRRSGDDLGELTHNVREEFAAVTTQIGRVGEGSVAWSMRSVCSARRFVT
jgi:hypothetical protein